jgi:hypothetical protein
MRHACAYWHPSHALRHLDKHFIPPTCCLLRSRASVACVSHSHFTSQHQPGRSHLLLLLRLVLLTLQQRKHAVLVVEIS